MSTSVASGIDPEDEKLLTIKDFTAELKSRVGKYVSESTVRSWITRGVSGCKLETYRFGGEVNTTWEAYQRWQANVSEARAEAKANGSDEEEYDGV